jgi:carboxymethylenebutenolidase
MGEIINYKRPDGQSNVGYLAQPAEGAKAPGVVMLHEYWGLNEQIKSSADKLASQGFRVLVPDMYQGKVAKNADEAGKLMGALDWGLTVGQVVRGAVQHLKSSSGGKVAVMGFCMGGAITLATAINVPDQDAAVCFYGLPSGQDTSKVRGPLLAHFATHDQWCTPERVSELEKDLKKGNVKFELYRYDAQHAFCNDRRPEVYNADAAKLAWERTTSFLQKQLG